MLFSSIFGIYRYSKLLYYEISKVDLLKLLHNLWYVPYVEIIGLCNKIDSASC